jgi:hypothetical protein
MGVHKINKQVNECGILHAKTVTVTLEKSKKWKCVKISHGPLYNGIFQFFPSINLSPTLTKSYASLIVILSLHFV